MFDVKLPEACMIPCMFEVLLYPGFYILMGPIIGPIITLVAGAFHELLSMREKPLAYILHSMLMKVSVNTVECNTLSIDNLHSLDTYAFKHLYSDIVL